MEIRILDHRPFKLSQNKNVESQVKYQVMLYLLGISLRSPLLS